MEGQIQRVWVVIGARISAAALLAVFLLLGLPLVAAAVEERVIINELMWDGLEYVELYNVGNDVDLDGWSLTRQQPNGEIKELVSFVEGDVIEAGDFFLVEEKEEATVAEGDKITSKLVLVNTGEQVVLLDAQGDVIDTANQLGGWFAGENTTTGVAMERGESESDGQITDSWHSSVGEVGGRNGTPGVENSVPEENIPPEAAVSGPVEGVVGEELIFTAEDSIDEDDDNLEYEWVLGDGEVGEGVEVAHEYAEAGTYVVEVTVSDGEAQDNAKLTAVITKPEYSDEVVINEFLPDPVGSDSEGEFIELKNIGSEVVDLEGWLLDDGEGGSAAYEVDSGEIAGGEIVLFKRTETKIALNNTGDNVRLFDPVGEEKDLYSYSETEEGYSFNRESDGEFVISTEPTPGEENKITEVEEGDGEESEDEESVEEEGEVEGDSITKVLLANIRDEEEGLKVEVEGVVSVPPGVYGERMIYLAGSGVQVYFSKEEWPDINLGDVVSLVGEISSVSGETRIKIAKADDVQVVRGGDPPDAHVVQTGQVDESKEGWLVTVQGHVAKTSGDTFYIDDGSGEVKVYIKESTGIDKPKMRKGMAVTVTGVVSETRSGYRVLPRWQEDVRLGLVAGMQSFPATGFVVNWAALGLIVLVIIFLLILVVRTREPLVR